MLARTDGTGVPTTTLPAAGRRRRRLWIAGAVATVAVAAAVYFWTSLFIACGCAPLPPRDAAGPSGPGGLATLPPGGDKGGVVEVAPGDAKGN